MSAGLDSLFLDTPAWIWSVFAALVAALLAFDLGVLHRRSREVPLKESLLLSGAYVAMACAFGVWTWITLGEDAGAAFFSGYLLEKSLSLDNIFVIAAIFGGLGIPRQHQHRVLFWGIVGVLVLRAGLIGLGSALVHEFAWILLVFGGFLLFAAYRITKPGRRAGKPVEGRIYKLVVRRLPVTPELQGGRFFVRQPHERGGMRLTATPLLLALLTIEFSDILFAIDSVPAIFAITTDPFVVYTSNIFAVLGLRALYFALSDVIGRFERLQTAMALLLGLAGLKIFYNQLFGKIDPIVSLAVTLSVLIGGVAYSFWRTGRRSSSSGHGGASVKDGP